MCQFTEKFIESIRLENSQVFLLELHQKRMNNVFSHYKKKNIHDLKDYLKGKNLPTNGKHKIRIIYDLNGKIDFEINPYFFNERNSFELINANNLHYSFKFENRDEINKIKQKSSFDEVIFCKNDKITDTSISNLIFKKNNEWFTPKTNLLDGIMREHLIETKQIRLLDINVKNLQEFSHFQMINALIPFGIKEYEISLIKNFNI